MEKQENRIRYLKELKDVVNLVKLTPEFINGLEQHLYFKDYVNIIKDFPESLKHHTILLELTRERSTCQAVINLLRNCGQEEAAKKLMEFNTSSGPMPLTVSLYLEVVKCLAPKKDLSNCYNLVKKFRGKCILINNVENLNNETNRFKNLFEQLNFTVQVITNMSADNLKKELKAITDDASSQMSLKDSEAFVLMAISHGEDEKVLGYNACEVIKKIHEGRIDSENPEAKQVINDDVLPIRDIIALFSGKESPLKSKPKLFFFTCCRTTDDTVPTDSNTNGDALKIIPKSHPVKGAGVDTFVAYACSKGYKTFFNPIHGFTFFGQALSHSIAQYACEESLDTIMKRTQKRLKDIYSEMEGEGDLMGNFATEVINYAMTKQLYFNPGIAE